MQTNTSLLLYRLQRERIALSYFCNHRLTALPGGSVIMGAAGAIGVSGLAPYEDRQIANLVAASAPPLR
jgi:uncharacterized protein GlcG (DUF336 family)